MEILTKKDIISYKLPVNPEILNETKGFAKRFPKVKDRVLSILRNDNYARRNYLWLSMVYWAKCGQIKIVVPLDKFNQVNSPETITRAFRKIMEEHRNEGLHQFLKHEAVDDIRYEREKEVRKYFKNSSLDN